MASESKDAERGELEWARFHRFPRPVVKLGQEAVDMGVGREPPLRVLVHYTCEVFNSHLCGSVSHGWVA